jgi:hypothetical protein
MPSQFNTGAELASSLNFCHAVLNEKSAAAAFLRFSKKSSAPSQETAGGLKT